MVEEHEVWNDKTSMTDDSAILKTPPIFAQEPEINRKRKILLILISTLLVLCLINFIFILYSYTTIDVLQSQLPNHSSQLVSIFISISYYGFGLLVTYRYYQTGLLVFAWLAAVSLLLIFSIVIVILIGIIVTASRIGFAKGIIIAIIFTIISLTSSFLQIVTVRYALILSKLLKNTKHLTLDQH